MKGSAEHSEGWVCARNPANPHPLPRLYVSMRLSFSFVYITYHLSLSSASFKLRIFTISTLLVRIWATLVSYLLC